MDRRGAWVLLAHLEERVAYGRSIRQRASCLIDAHGPRAEAEALLAAEEPGLAAAEQSFWDGGGGAHPRGRAGTANVPLPGPAVRR